MPIGSFRLNALSKVSAVLSGTNALTFINYQTSTNTSLNPPSNLTVGDLLVCLCVARNTTTTIPTDMAPAGWTQIGTATDATTKGTRISAFYKISTGTETTITTMTGTETTASWSASWRPSTAFTTVNIGGGSNYSLTNAQPSNITLTRSGLDSQFIGFASYFTDGIPTTVYGGTTTTSVAATRSFGPSGNLWTNIYEGNATSAVTLGATQDWGSGNGIWGFTLGVSPSQPSPPAVSSVQLITSKTGLSSSSGNFVIPTGGDTSPNFFNVEAGDVAVLFDSSTTTTDTTPSGWTSITKSTTSGIRQNISYKKLVAGDLGATITGMAGVNRKVMLIYRGDVAVNTITPIVIGTQATTLTPTNQTMFTGDLAPVVSFACYSSTGTVSTRGWSVGSPSEYTSVSTSSIYVKALITNSGSPSTTVISMSDGGTNALQTFRIKFA